MVLGYLSRLVLSKLLIRFSSNFLLPLFLLNGVFSSERASLIAQLVKNPPGMQETPVQFLDWEDPLQKG